ncbi:hypothetical protein HDU79_010447 [Rhizoclosmatium sp. JEL0117]|nr:hypothetical protein HDU79_010447 [Rhizoclosmatium sp. JEL0117]
MRTHLLIAIIPNLQPVNLTFVQLVNLTLRYYSPLWVNKKPETSLQTYMKPITFFKRVTVISQECCFARKNDSVKSMYDVLEYFEHSAIMHGMLIFQKIVRVVPYALVATATGLLSNNRK